MSSFFTDSECDLDQLTALLEEDDNDGDVDDTKTKSSEEADDRNPHEKNEAHKCNGEEVMNTETS